MTPSGPIPESFERDYGCTDTEWRRWMPDATGVATEPGRCELRVPVGQGWLLLRWQVLPPRVIALVRLPRLQVAFRFSESDEAARASFMRRFDLHLQRGGG